ncbi:MULTISPECIES: squalene synthase HpnC [unclassified Janthinobacterium]|uniref:squalene synthase HpnC n=1 Tax=unclassified Janthinobacterium TaxID=2610881 RepID=UPI0004767D98|nr:MULTISPECIES: squalene synthase HpnC [unclassified Janthinobacterium]MEC5160754.1 squalene synthase HpnC [Janthinobacterium sp. CG_S6]
MPVDHYENFPVASVLLPRRLVPAVEAIYAFARSADDLADEGDATPAERLAALQAYEAALDRIHRKESGADPMFERLALVIAKHELPLKPFYDLLSAFKQDVVVTRYADFATLLDYCRRSANPVGALMLNLYKAADEDNLRDSDAICSALQLINFLQDVAIDQQKERIYLPLEDLTRFAVSPAALERAESHGKWSALMRFEVARARALLLSGAPLALRLRGRIGWELRLVVQGGLRILEAIETVNYDVFRRRPALQKRDWLVICWRALRMRAKKAR